MHKWSFSRPLANFCGTVRNERHRREIQARLVHLAARLEVLEYRRYGFIVISREVASNVLNCSVFDEAQLVFHGDSTNRDERHGNRGRTLHAISLEP